MKNLEPIIVRLRDIAATHRRALEAGEINRVNKTAMIVEALWHEVLTRYQEKGGGYAVAECHKAWDAWENRSDLADRAIQIVNAQITTWQRNGDLD